MTGVSSGVSSPSRDMSAGSTSWEPLRVATSLKMEPRRGGFLCFGVSGMGGEDEVLGVGLPEGSTMDFERSRLALEKSLGSLGPELELVGDDGEGDARDDLPDIVVDGKETLGADLARTPPTRATVSGSSAPILPFSSSFRSKCADLRLLSLSSSAPIAKCSLVCPSR